MKKADAAAQKTLLDARLGRMRLAISRAKLDAFLLTHASDIQYTTGFSGHDSVAILTPRSLVIITDSRYAEEVEADAPHVRAIIRKGSMEEAIAKAVAGLKSGKLGFESSHTTYGTIANLKKSLSKSGRAIKLVGVSDLTTVVRSIKDVAEIQTISQAIDVAEQSFMQVIRKVRPGKTEGQVAGELILAMRSRGATDASFQPIIGAGAHSSLPHYRPDDTVIQNNEPLLIDWGATYRGYRSDLTRTVFLGKPSAKMEKIYKIVLEAQLAGIAAIKAGADCSEVDAAARSVIKKAGFGKQFGHSLGHGIGLDVHEEPRLHVSRKGRPLQVGQIVTVEPGIYLPGVGGVRIEDDILVSEAGPVVLSSLEKSFEWATQVIGG
jgi:Xaa-Pro aminopeptidase